MKRMVSLFQGGLGRVRRLLIQMTLRAKGDLRYGFILGHMRSGSTLLLHILASHPEILAGGERNKTYRDLADLQSLIVDVCLQEGRLPLRCIHVVDQINHNNMTPSWEVLNHYALKRIFLLRRPTATIASIVRTFEPIYGNWPVERAARYYIDRVSNLGTLAQAASDPERSLFCRYEDLIRNPEHTLSAVQRFFGLSTALSTEYRLQKYTGGRGDPSPRVRSGRILPESPITDFDIPELLFREATDTYESSVDVLKKCSLPLN